MTLQYLKTQLKNKLFPFIKRTSQTRVQLNKWLKTIVVEADKVLEVGAGFNPIIKKVKVWKVKKYKTLDNNLENPCNPDFNLDLNRFSYKDPVAKQVFKYKPNIIFCIEVMEYIYKPDKVLKFFYDILSSKGILYISFHTIYPVHQPYKYDSLRYTKWGIINLLKDAGFSKWEITARVATKGLKELKAFYKKEKMSSLKNSNLPFDIGYFVKATK